MRIASLDLVLVIVFLGLPACSTSEDVVDAAPELGVDAGTELGADAGAELGADGGRDLGPDGDLVDVDGSICPASYLPDHPMFDRSCETDADCVAVSFWTSCCTQRVGGFSTSELDALVSVRDACDAHAYHDCGCPTRATADDGSIVYALGPSAFTVHCDAHICSTSATSCTACAPPTPVCVSECISEIVSHTCIASPPSTCDGSTSCACLAAADASPCGTGTCADLPEGGTSCTCR